MSEQKKRYIRLGLFVISTSALLIVAIYLIGNNKNLFGANFAISTILTDAGGLQVGNNVHYAGLNVGTVDKISMISDSTIKVDLKIAERIRPYIKKDAVARISIDGIVGSTLINIVPGSGEAAEIEEGDVLESASLPGTSDLISTLGNTNLNVAKFVEDLLEISKSIKEGPGMVNTLIEDPNAASDLVLTVRNLQRASEKSISILSKLESEVSALEHSKGLIHQLVNDTVVMTNLIQMSKSLHQNYTEQLSPLIHNLEKSGEHIAKSASDLVEILDSVKNSEGTIHLLLYDTNVASSTANTLQNLEEGTAKFNENMEALKHSFLTRRYFRKMEKRKNQEEKIDKN